MRLACHAGIVLFLAVASCAREPVKQTSRTGGAHPIAAAAGAPDTTFESTLSPVEPADIPAAIRSACDTAMMLVHETLGLVPRRHEGRFTDSFQSTPRIGCRLVAIGASGTARDSTPPVDALERAFSRHRWGMDLRYAADGPDGSDVGLRFRDVLCVVVGRWDGGDDADTTAAARGDTATANSFAVIVECAHDVASNADAGVPDSIWRVASARGLDSVYAIAVRLQYPPYLEGDFDGDGVRDAAVLIEQRATGKLGVAFVLMGPRRVAIVGAGTAIAGGPDDLAWIDQWDVYRKGVSFSLTIHDRPGVPLLADALWVARRDSASAFVIWSGGGYAWEKRGR